MSYPVHPIDTARVELLLAELRLPAVKHVWAALAAQAGQSPLTQLPECRVGRDGKSGRRNP